MVSFGTHREGLISVRRVGRDKIETAVTKRRGSSSKNSSVAVFSYYTLCERRYSFAHSTAADLSILSESTFYCSWMWQP
ncbi:hypothetical protein MRX96_029409 [Rhipicephalus microplus]